MCEVPVEWIEGECDQPPLLHRNVEDGALADDCLLALHEPGDEIREVSASTNLFRCSCVSHTRACSDYLGLMCR